MTSIPNSLAMSPAPSGQAGPVMVARRYLEGRRGLYTLALMLAVVALVFGGAWWGFAAILPLLYVLLCAAMMAMCMRGHGGSGQNSDAKPGFSSNLVGGPTPGEAGSH